MGNCCSCERIYALLSGSTNSRSNYATISDSDKSSEEVSPFQKDRSSYHSDDQPKKVIAPVSQVIEINKRMTKHNSPCCLPSALNVYDLACVSTYSSNDICYMRYLPTFHFNRQ